MKKRRKSNGFTLIEMIVATFLLAIAVAGALAAFANAARGTGFADQLHRATLLAQKKMTEIELAQDSLSGGDQQGDFGDDNPGYRWQESVETTDYQNLYRVILTVTWDAGSRQRVFTTYLRNTSNDGQNGSSGGSQTGTGQGANGG